MKKVVLLISIFTCVAQPLNAIPGWAASTLLCTGSAGIGAVFGFSSYSTNILVDKLRAKRMGNRYIAKEFSAKKALAWTATCSIIALVPTIAFRHKILDRLFPAKRDSNNPQPNSNEKPKDGDSPAKNHLDALQIDPAKATKEQLNQLVETTYADYPHETMRSASDKITVTPLLDAILKNDKKRAQKLIKAGADLEKRGSNNRSPLAEAIVENNWPMAELLLDAGAQINPTDNTIETPLGHATGLNDDAAFEIIEKLIARGADVNQRWIEKGREQTALKFAYQMYHFPDMPHNKDLDKERLKKDTKPYLDRYKKKIDLLESHNATHRPIDLFHLAIHTADIKKLENLLTTHHQAISKKEIVLEPLLTDIVCEWFDAKKEIAALDLLAKAGADLNYNKGALLDYINEKIARNPNGYYRPEYEAVAAHLRSRGVRNEK